MYGQLMKLNWPHVAFVYRITACNLPVEERMEGQGGSGDRRSDEKSAGGKKERQWWNTAMTENEEGGDKGHMLK